MVHLPPKWVGEIMDEPVLYKIVGLFIFKRRTRVGRPREGLIERGGGTSGRRRSRVHERRQVKGRCRKGIVRVYLREQLKGVYSVWIRC